MRVRRFMDEEVRPAEEKLRDNEADRNGYIGAIVGLRQRAQDLGLWNPHMPAGVGRHGPRARRDGVRLRRGGPHGHRAVHPQRQAPDEGNMHTLLHFATPEQKEKYLRPLAEGRVALVLRDDRARGRRLRPDAASRRAP